MKRIGYAIVDGMAKIAPALGALLALAMFALLMTCAAIGAVAISDGYWDFSL